MCFGKGKEADSEGVRKFTLVPELVYECRHVTIVSSLRVPSIKAP
jgi:hypothetical protein